MKRLINITLAIALAIGGMLAGATAGSLVPPAGEFLGSTSASAEGLTAQQAGPLTPSPVGSGFTYQGRLQNNGSPTNGSYDFTFKLYDEASAGTLVSGPISVTTTISNGLFTANLDFGTSAFNGDARYMEIATRQTGGGGYTTLSPRQPITPAPYALFALDTPPYDNLVVVAKSGGDFTTITAALNSITDNSTNNKYLVWVAPGTYTEEVWMKQWVDIEGAGELLTRITFTSSPGSNISTVVGADNAALRSLTAEHVGGTTHAIAINSQAASPTLLNVTAIASGGSSINYGVSNSNASPNMTNVTAIASGGTTSYGVYNASSSPVMNNVTATASGGSNSNIGVYSQSASSPMMTNVKATASGGNISYGVSNNSASPIMNNVTATASNGSTYNYGVYSQSSAAPVMNNVTATASGGSTSSNFGVSNNSASPTMNNVTATASGGTTSYGVNNQSAAPVMNNVTATASGGADNNHGVYNAINSSPTMTNVNVTAFGGTNSYGVRNFSNSSPTMTNVNVTASGGTNSYGVYNTSSSPTIQNSNIRAAGGTNNYGIYNITSGTVRIDNSKITASTNTINNGAGVFTRVGASQLSGGNVSGGGTEICTASYDESYVSPGLNVCP